MMQRDQIEIKDLIFNVIVFSCLFFDIQKQFANFEMFKNKRKETLA